MDTGGKLTKRQIDKLETAFNRLPGNKTVVYCPQSLSRPFCIDLQGTTL